ncbi:hypothetical protein BUZ06_10900 [Staphylococcus gallinarum]|nr:hypothetical protein BUZ05_10340 [Staphylococcus gallinarum]PTK94744.1 hypothetical protein BUZ13_03920 [Staphylococcus gallinarum]RIO87445.1 hypothetical protein BUZ06_10900 [Staphylococcus gallinarum]
MVNIALLTRRVMMKSVYLKKINSFTYLELLFVLLVISIICALIPILIKSVSTFNKIADFDDVELIYLAKDLTDDQVVHNAKYVSINDVGNTLTLKQGNQIITYRFRNNKLIKTVNHSGNITMINNIRSVYFQKVNNDFIKLKLKLYIKGELIERQIYF